LLLLPFHAERRIGQHVVESDLPPAAVALEAILGECVAEDDVVGVLTLDEHVGLADGPCLVVPVLAEKVRAGLGIEIADVLLGNRKHAAGAACRVVDGFDNVAAGEVLLRGEEQVDHELDHFARCEVFSGLFIGLLGADSDEFLEDVAHLAVVHALRGEIDLGESLDHLVDESLLRHLCDLLVEGEPLHDGADIRREGVDVAIEVGRELVGIVEQLCQVELGQIVERAADDLLELVADDVLGLALDCAKLLQNLRLRRSQQAVEPPEYGQRQDHLPVLVPFVRAAKQIADVPDEVG